MKINIALFLLIIFVISCNNTSNENGKHDAQESVLDETHIEIAFPVTSDIDPIPRNTKFFGSKKNEYLAISNQSDNGIYIFEFKSKKIIKKIILKKEGPNSIGTLDGFDVTNLDTIFVTSRKYFNKLFLVDTSALIKKVINFKSVMPKGMFFTLAVPENRLNCEIYHNQSYIALGNEFRGPVKGFKNIHKYSIGFSYNFQTNIIDTLPICYPEIGEVVNQTEAHYSMSFTADKKVFSFMYDHNLYVSTANKKFKSYTCKSRFFKKERKKRPNSMHGSVNNFLESSFYMSILYDPYRKIYYRFVYPGVEISSKDNAMELNSFKQLFAIMVLDEEFNVLGETLLPKNTYNPDSYFINKEGLWLSTNHVNNPLFDPSFLKFELLKLSKNE